MLFTVKQFLISFKKLSTKQAQLLNIKSSWSMFYEEKKEINKQDLLNTHEALLIFQDMNTIVPWFRVKNFKTTVLRCGQRRNALIFKEADSSLTKLITKIKTKFTTCCKCLWSAGGYLSCQSKHIFHRSNLEKVKLPSIFHRSPSQIILLCNQLIQYYAVKTASVKLTLFTLLFLFTLDRKPKIGLFQRMKCLSRLTIGQSQGKFQILLSTFYKTTPVLTTCAANFFVSQSQVWNTSWLICTSMLKVF